MFFFPFVHFKILTYCIFSLQRFSHVLRIVEPVIALGPTGPHTVEGLYNIVYIMRKSLEGHDAAPSERYEHRAGRRHD